MLNHLDFLILLRTQKIWRFWIHVPKRQQLTGVGSEGKPPVFGSSSWVHLACVICWTLAGICCVSLVLVSVLDL